MKCYAKKWEVFTVLTLTHYIFSIEAQKLKHDECVLNRQMKRKHKTHKLRKLFSIFCLSIKYGMDLMNDLKYFLQHNHLLWNGTYALLAFDNRLVLRSILHWTERVLDTDQTIAFDQNKMRLVHFVLLSCATLTKSQNKHRLSLRFQLFKLFFFFFTIIW